MKLEGARILVTGGAGLIGSTTIDQLLANEKPREIIVLDNMSRGTTRNLENALKDERVKLVQGDIRDKDMVMKVTEGMDAVIHMAAIRITACAADPREAMEVMNDGTFNVIDAAHQQGVKKVLAASSASVLASRTLSRRLKTIIPTTTAPGMAHPRSCWRACCAPIMTCTA